MTRLIARSISLERFPQLLILFANGYDQADEARVGYEVDRIDRIKSIKDGGIDTDAELRIDIAALRRAIERDRAASQLPSASSPMPER